MVNEVTLPDYIAVKWHIDDVKGLIDMYNLPIEGMSDDDFREVLQIAGRCHDATIGINWDVLEVHLEWYARENGFYKESEDEKL